MFIPHIIHFDPIVCFIFLIESLVMFCCPVGVISLEHRVHVRKRASVWQVIFGQTPLQSLNLVLLRLDTVAKR
jgi:hypothetical protein